MPPSDEKAINWARRPELDAMTADWHVHAIPPKGISNAIILSGDITGAYVHFAAGRTQPCAGDNCKICAENIAPRWEGYLAVTSGDLKARTILRITPAAMKPIDEYFRSHRTLRGAYISISRLGGKPNGKLRSSLTDGKWPTEALPQAPNMQKLLAAMWGLHSSKKATSAPPLIIHDAPKTETDFGEGSMEAG